MVLTQFGFVFVLQQNQMLGSDGPRRARNGGQNANALLALFPGGDGNHNSLRAVEPCSTLESGHAHAVAYAELGTQRPSNFLFCLGVRQNVSGTRRGSAQTTWGFVQWNRGDDVDERVVHPWAEAPRRDESAKSTQNVLGKEGLELEVTKQQEAGVRAHPYANAVQRFGVEIDGGLKSGFRRGNFDAETEQTGFAVDGNW